MSRKLTQEEVIQQFRKVHGDRYDYSKVKYVNNFTKVEIMCPVHGSFLQSPNSHKSGHGCNKCIKRKKIKQEVIIDQFKEIHGNKYNYDKVDYKNSREPVEIVCPIHGSFHQTPDNHKRGQGCRKCAYIELSKMKLKVEKNKSLGGVRPDLIKYLKNMDDAFKYHPKSDIAITIVCHDCGFEKEMQIKQLTNRGFRCPICSDGISTPEKFIGNLLIKLDIQFKTQYKPKWSNNKRYDFYLSDYNTIIETHGEQHYRNTFSTMKGARTLKEEQVNDKYKEELALKNGIENYIIINCKTVTLNKLKENTIKELSPHFNLSNVNWMEIWTDCQKSIVKQVCDAWNDNYRIVDIKNKFNISNFAIFKYLKIGTDLDWCDYNPRHNNN